MWGSFQKRVQITKCPGMYAGNNNNGRKNARWELNRRRRRHACPIYLSTTTTTQSNGMPRIVYATGRQVFGWGRVRNKILSVAELKFCQQPSICLLSTALSVMFVACPKRLAGEGPGIRGKGSVVHPGCMSSKQVLSCLSCPTHSLPTAG